ncbi:MAG: hypothetical protein IKA81_06695 [Alistipes sp.]|nr:hypothetical protein [Alistipes sp.]
MKRFLLSFMVVATMVAAISCSSKREWSDKERHELRKELKAYRDMVYLDNLAETEFDAFTGDVVEAIEVDYPVYTTFIELPGRGDTVEVYVVSMIVNELTADAHNMRNIYPYPWLVAEGILPSGLNHQAQRAFYECFASKVNSYYKSTEAFFDAIVDNTASDSVLTNMQLQCAADLFDWGIEIDETIIVD